MKTKTKPIIRGKVQKGDILYFQNGNRAPTKEFIGARISDWLMHGHKSAVYRPIKSPKKARGLSIPPQVDAWGAQRPDGTVLPWTWGFRRNVIDEIKGSKCKAVEVTITLRKGK